MSCLHAKTTCVDDDDSDNIVVNRLLHGALVFLISDNISHTIQFFVSRGDNNHFSPTEKLCRKFNNQTVNCVRKHANNKRYIYLIVSSIILFAVFHHAANAHYCHHDGNYSHFSSEKILFIFGPN